jgi:hypothetical protein
MLIKKINTFIPKNYFLYKTAIDVIFSGNLEIYIKVIFSQSTIPPFFPIIRPAKGRDDCPNVYKKKQSQVIRLQTKVTELSELVDVPING